jgi:hypothetical protein
MAWLLDEISGAAERVWAGTGSAARTGAARSYDGFHHPAQGTLLR